MFMTGNFRKGLISSAYSPLVLGYVMMGLDESGDEYSDTAHTMKH
jgi:hypothetical protein